MMNDCNWPINLRHMQTPSGSFQVRVGPIGKRCWGNSDDLTIFDDIKGESRCQANKLYQISHSSIRRHMVLVRMIPYPTPARPRLSRTTVLLLMDAKSLTL